MVKHKILFVNGHLNVGGVEKSLVDLLRWLDYSQYDVDLLLLEEKGDYLEQIPQNVNIIYKDIRSAYGPFFNTFFENLIRGRFNIIYYRFILLISSLLGKEFLRYWDFFFKLSHNYDSAIAYRPGICADVVAYAVRSKKKICWWHHGECLFSKAQIRATNRVWKSFDNIVTVSRGCKNMIESIFDYPSAQIVVIPNLIDIERISLLAGEESPYDLSSKATRIVTVGRLSPEKHIEDIPLIASELIKRGINQFKWYIVGEGDMRGLIEKEIRDKNVVDYVCLLGSKSNPYPYIKFADMMVHTSHVESQGLAILEAMALKTPCVAVASMGPKEYLNSELGILVGRDVNSVRDGVIRLLLQQYDATIVSKAYEVVKKYYSPDVIVRLLDGLVIDK